MEVEMFLCLSLDPFQTDADPRSRYIATQGPMLNTTNAFWQMVWEQGSCVIVALTRPSRIICSVVSSRLFVSESFSWEWSDDVSSLLAGGRFETIQWLRSKISVLRRARESGRRMSIVICLGQSRLGTSLVGWLRCSKFLFERQSNDGNTHCDPISFSHLGWIKQSAVSSIRTRFSSVSMRCSLASFQLKRDDERHVTKSQVHFFIVKTRK